MLDLDRADVLNLLFELCPKQDGREYNNQEVADGAGLSRQSVSHWRLGKRRNISLDNAVAIANFFDVSIEVFQCQTRAEVIRVIARSHEGRGAVETDALLQRILEKVLGRWSGQERKLILTIIEQVIDHTAQLTELPPQPDDPEP